MIPKVIHYCWFGNGPKSSKMQKCIASWKKYCPDYQIIEWNESNFDVHQNAYLSWCYDQKKWAFFSDYARLLIIYEHGGIYFDTDVELVKRPDDLLRYEAFFGFENKENINTGLGFGATAHQPMVAAMKTMYEKMTPDDEGNFNLIGCPKLNTEALLPFGLKKNGERQMLCGGIILPAEYLNPYDDPTGKLNITPQTISIHWYAKSWLSSSVVLRSKIMKPLHRILGTDAFARFRK
ncbi:MAG: glycosyltransferase [Lachnospiraceae bacterium]|nr:glycosyltransferase [Lachnospiraceae bacterium]